MEGDRDRVPPIGRAEQCVIRGDCPVEHAPADQVPVTLLDPLAYRREAGRPVLRRQRILDLLEAQFTLLGDDAMTPVALVLDEPGVRQIGHAFAGEIEQPDLG